jgi:4-amino-4-deoxy-L-arabinose transferase-like glycosyltransferase
MTPTIDSAPADAPRVSGPPSRREWSIVVVIVVVSFLLRAALPGRMAVEHFDEGVYASNLYSGNQDPSYAYPDRHLYAPPLFPALLEWAIILSGGRAQAALWVNVLAGSLTILVMWWGSRQWFGPAAGVISATLAATSDYHIAFSRMALTDVPLGLWMAGGVFAGWRAVLTGRPIWIICAAVLSALAWWTKYNGWLTLAVAGSGTVAWLLFDRRRTVSAGQALGRWIVVAAAAALLWLPCLATIPAGSSYADISANHAKYFVGLSGWWQSLLWHVGTQRYLDGWSTVAGFVLAAGAAAWVNCERFTWNGNLAAGAMRRWLAAIVVGLAAGSAAIALGSTIVLALIALIWLASLGTGRWAAIRFTSDGQGAISSRESMRLAVWMVAAWFAGLFMATPLYHPYPRLALPWLVACWLAAGTAAGRILDRPIGGARSADRPDRWRPVGAAMLILALAVPVAVWRGPPLAPARWIAWQDRTALEGIAADLLRDAARVVKEPGPARHSELDAVFYVFGEPGLFFQLQTAANESGLRFVAAPAKSLALRDPVEVAVFLVTGPHAHRSGTERDPAVRHYRPIAAYSYRPSDLVSLDEYPAARLLENEGPAADEIRLYLVHGPQRQP